MVEKKRWKGLKTIGMVETTIVTDDKKRTERRYYISSENVNIETVCGIIKMQKVAA